MTSRFYAADASDTESETSSSEDELQAKPVVQQRKFQWSDDDEDIKRIVRSAKDKRYEELTNKIKDIKNHKKIKDMHNVLQDFEDLCKAFDKAKKVVEKEGMPRFYIRCLVELEDFVSECWEDRVARKAMSKNNAKGLTTLRQKMRKYTRDTYLEKEIAAYREKPDVEESNVDADQDEPVSDEDDIEGPEIPASDFFKAKAPKKVTIAKDGDDDDSDSDMDWGSDSDTESDDDDDIPLDTKLGPDIFRKKVTTDDNKEKEREKRRRERRERREEMEKDSDDDDKDGEWTTIKGGAPLTSERPKMFSKDAEITHDAVKKKRIEIISARGKKATDRNTQIEMLIELRSIAAAHNLGIGVDIKLMFDVVSAIFDYNSSIANCMKSEMWEKCVAFVQDLLEKLQANSDIIVGANVAEESEDFATGPPFRVRACILTICERLDEEFIKMLQGCDAHSTEYVDRLKDERVLCKILRDLEEYLNGRATTEEICRVYLKRVEHMYYKFDKRSRRLLPGETPQPEAEEPAKTEPEVPKVEITIVDAKPADDASTEETKEGDEKKPKKKKVPTATLR